MNKLILLAWLLLLGAAGPGRASALPADTLRGQAHFVRHLSTSMCQHMATEMQGKEAGKLSADECQALFGKLVLSSMADNLSEFQTVLKQAKSVDADALGQQMGEQAVIQLMQACPAARPVIIRMGMLSSGLTEGVEPAERSVLLPIVQSICQRLDEENAKQPLEKRTPAQRSELMETEMQGALLAKSSDLTGYYGDEALEDSKLSEQIGQKIGILMAEQCPSYLLMAAQDAEAPAEAAPAATPKPAPAAKKAAAHPVPKRPAKK